MAPSVSRGPGGLCGSLPLRCDLRTRTLFDKLMDLGSSRATEPAHGFRVLRRLFAAALVALLWAADARPWPGGHRTLGCGECHPQESGAGGSAAALLDPDRVALCLRCHEGMRDPQPSAAVPFVGHPGWGYAPRSMYEHYRGWIEGNRSLLDPPLSLGELRMTPEGSGYRFDCTTCHPAGQGSNGYSRIGLVALELCVACHGGESPASDPGFPRILYNPAHLGNAENGVEYEPVAGALRDGSEGSGIVHLPLAVFTRVHTNPRQGLGYVVEVDFGRDGGVDLQEYVTETTPSRAPMRWQMGNPPRWPGESQLHGLSTVSWPAGEHEVKLIPFDAIWSRAGVAQTLRVVQSGRHRALQSIAKGLKCGRRLWDSLLRTWEDDRGNVLRLYCATGGWNVDEFRLFFGTPLEKGRLVGRCSAEGGENSDSVVHAGDHDGNGKPDAFFGTVWRSRREVWLGPGAETIEWRSYEYDAISDRLLLKRYHSEDGPGGQSPDLLREELEDVDPMDFDWLLEPAPRRYQRGSAGGLSGGSKKP